MKDYKAIAEKEKEIIELLWKAIVDNTITIPKGSFKLKKELESLESDQSSVTAEEKTERQIILEIMDCYTDEIEGLDFKHIPDYKFNSVTLDIIHAMEEYAQLCQPRGKVYEKEFIEWFTGENSPVAILYGNQVERFATKEKDYTIYGLYQYWLKEIKAPLKKISNK
jgi:hypothetical protein